MACFCVEPYISTALSHVRVVLNAHAHLPSCAVWCLCAMSPVPSLLWQQVQWVLEPVHHHVRTRGQRVRSLGDDGSGERYQQSHCRLERNPAPAPLHFRGTDLAAGARCVCVSSNAMLLGLPPPIVVCRVMWCAVREERRLARVSEPLTVPDFLLFLTSLCSCRVS